ncbi:MAG: glycosyltransferase [Balneola sp.]|nr:MAG: glycosyltransferase [Balneola sp.]
MLQLIELFQHQGWDITFASAASKSKYSTSLESINIDSVTIRLNDPSFDQFIEDLKPDLVLFDRYMTEEQFGWRVAESCPNAIRILDTEDLHGLREGRNIALKEGRSFHQSDLLNSISLREIASVFRCDLSLIISESEMELLEGFYKIDLSLVHYIPFMINSLTYLDIKEWKGFEEREHFVWIGNFLHEPNLDAVQYLKKEIWPVIRKQLPKAELHIYGAYPKEKVFQLNNEKEGFLVKGRASTVESIFSNSRILLAPIRFGAGLKGKCIEAMQYGLPSVTTKIGAEGIPGELPWPGAIADSAEQIIKEAIALYTSSTEWDNAQAKGVEILYKRFDKQKHGSVLIQRIEKLRDELTQHRTNNFVGAMLQHQSMSSTKFMGKWIEEKNRSKES